jgi:hypothetical protein
MFKIVVLVNNESYFIDEFGELSHASRTLETPMTFDDIRTALEYYLQCFTDGVEEEVEGFSVERN